MRTGVWKKTLIKTLQVKTLNSLFEKEKQSLDPTLFMTKTDDRGRRGVKIPQLSGT